MRNWIKEKLKTLNKTQKGLADVLDLAHPRINELISGNRELATREVQAFAKFMEMSVMEVIERLADDNPNPLVVGATRHVSVRSHVQAGSWGDNPQWEDSEWYDVAIPKDDDLAPYALHAAEARGPSMNKRYPEGTVLVFTDNIETMEQIAPGKRYIVERERADGLREATVKLLVLEDDGTYWLWPESTDPNHQTPIHLNGDDGDTIRIVGQVRYSVVRE